VTAGHLALERERGFGYLQIAKVQIGYEGQTSAGDPNLETRYGISVATPFEFLEEENYGRDVAFIQLNRPFTDISPFAYRDTPISGTSKIGIVGYPSDKNLDEYMFERFETVGFPSANRDRQT
jgi:V8-like Glu-specific endopeptidase